MKTRFLKFLCTTAFCIMSLQRAFCAAPTACLSLRASAWNDFGASLACDFGLNSIYTLRPYSNDFFSLGFALNYIGHSEESYYFNYSQRELNNYCVIQPRIAYNLVLGAKNPFHIYAGPMAGIGLNFYLYDFRCEGMDLYEHRPDYRPCACAGAFVGCRYLINHWGLNFEVQSSKRLNLIHIGAFLQF